MEFLKSIRHGCELALSCAIVAGVMIGPVRAEPRLGTPVQHGNLAIYPVLGPSTPGPVPLTLQEALAGGVVEVEETGNVRQLKIE